MMRSRMNEGVVTALLLLVPGILLGQSFNTTIRGTVTDPSGAVIPGAELTLKSADTDTVARFTAGAQGLYQFGNLARGTYDLSVSAKGFRDFVQKGIVVNINETRTVNVKLEVGASEQRIEVTAEGSPLNQVDATIKQSISPTTIEQLPLAVALAEGKPLEEAISFANCAAAISVTRLGAQTSIPTRSEVEALLATPALSI